MLRFSGGDFQRGDGVNTYIWESLLYRVIVTTFVIYEITFEEGNKKLAGFHLADMAQWLSSMYEPQGHH